MAIRGNEGVGVYLRDAGYVVEHFRLLANETRIVFASEPFKSREKAEAFESEYRAQCETD
jgi:uncharacterized protein YegP (UPF0339 family)